MIYLDNHATTPCDRRVVEQMVPWLTESFGNPHSTSHQLGRDAAEGINAAMATIGSHLGVSPDAILATSGATESNNLAIAGVCQHPRQKRRHIVTSTIEHPAVLDVVARLQQDGFRITRVPVHAHEDAHAGLVDLDALASAVCEDTALVSIHWANNEIGVIQPMDEIAAIAHQCGALVHSDATQAVGRIPVDLAKTDVDLISASAHKLYGPKGVGLLTFASGVERRRVRLKPLIVGGGQQRNLRSGTLSPANIVAMATAIQIAIRELDRAAVEVANRTRQLWSGLSDAVPGVRLNGPELDSHFRLPGNLNLMLPNIEGEAWMAACPEVAFSSGSACSSVDAKPSHVLTGIGLSESEARRSVRFGIGKFNTDHEIGLAIERLAEAYYRLAG